MSFYDLKAAVQQLNKIADDEEKLVGHSCDYAVRTKLFSLIISGNQCLPGRQNCFENGQQCYKKHRFFF